MVEAFTLQLSDARREAGWMGELQVWYCAVAEIFRIALPLQAARGALVIPIVSVASSGAVFFGLTWALQNSLALHVAYRHWLDKLGG